MTDEELKEQRDAVLKGIYELRLLRPTMIGLLENYERWITTRVRFAAERSTAEACAEIAEAYHCAAAIRARFNLNDAPAGEKREGSDG